MKTCPDCNGDGVVEKGTDDGQQCPTCGGRGFAPDDDDHHEEGNKDKHQINCEYVGVTDVEIKI
jgi:RecJ-like exonuclease